jgi:hypothetical protein
MIAQDIAQAAEVIENVTGVNEVTITVKDLFYIMAFVVAGVSAYLLGRFKVQRMEDKISEVKSSLNLTKDEVRKEKDVLHNRIGKTKDEMSAQLSKLNDKMDKSMRAISTDLAEIKGYLKGKDED